MTGLEWRQRETLPCPWCGETPRVKTLRGRLPVYCSVTCSRRASSARRAMRAIKAEAAERYAPARVALTVGEEFALLRKQRKARMDGRA